MLEKIVSEKWLTAKGVCGFWPCARDGDDVELYLIEEERHVRLPFLRQQCGAGQSTRSRADHNGVERLLQVTSHQCALVAQVRFVHGWLGQFVHSVG